MLIICIIRVPIFPSNKLGAFCRGKHNNALQINKLLDSGFMTFFITNCGMECCKEEHIRKIPKPVTFEWHFRPCKASKFNRQQQSYLRLYHRHKPHLPDFHGPQRSLLGKPGPQSPLQTKFLSDSVVPEFSVSVILPQLQHDLFLIRNSGIFQSTHQG